MKKTNTKKLNLNSFHWFGIIVLFALIVRVLYSLSVSGDPLMNYLPASPDSDFFHNWASGMVQSGDWGGEGVFFIGPLYAYFLALIYSISGPSLYVIRIMQLLLGAFTAGFAFAAADRIWNRLAGIVAGIVMAIYLPALFFGALILPATLILFLVAAGLYFLIVGIDLRRPWFFAVSGTFLGIAALGRPNLLLFAVVISLVLYFVKKAEFHWKLLAGFILPIVICVSVTFIHNIVKEDEPILISSQGGINFYIGNSEAAFGIDYSPIVGMDRPEELNKTGAKLYAEKSEGKTLTPSQVSRFWFGEGLKFIKDNPGSAANLYLRKIRLLTNSYEVALNYDYYFMQFRSYFHGVIPPWFGIVLALGVTGMVLARKELDYRKLALILFAAVYAASIVVFFITARYRLPLIFPLIVFSGGAVTFAVQKIKERKFLPLGIAGTIVIALLAISLIPISGLSRSLGYADTYYKYATMYSDEGHLDKAIENYKKAVSVDPSHYASLNKLGIYAINTGELDQAKEYFRLAKDAYPDDSLANFNYAMLLYEEQDYVGAMKCFKIAADNNPEYARAWRYYAECAIYNGETENAMIALENSVTLIPGDAESRVRLAEIYFDIGERGRARKQAEMALSINTRTPGANLVVAKCLFIDGDLDGGLSFLVGEQRISGDTPQVLITHAEVLERLGMYEDAAKYYKQYLAIGGRPIARLEKYNN